MNKKEIQERIAAIQEELREEGADVSALRTEFDELRVQLDKINEDEQARKQLLDDIANERVESTVVKSFEPEEKNKTGDVQARNYESAFTKKFIGGELTEGEKRALDTTSGALLIPPGWQQKIYDDIRENHPILEDLTWQSINAIVEFPKRVAITSGDAAVVTEGQCAPDEVNEWGTVKVELEEIQKMIELTAKMGLLLPEAFKNWFITEVRNRIGHQMAVRVIAALKAQMAATNKINAATPGAVDVTDVTKLFGLADGDGVPKVYANRTTVWGNLANIKGAQGQDAYLPNLQDPISGNLIGYQVRQESGMADGEIMVVFPDNVFYNVPEGVRVKQMEDSCFKIKISGIVFAGAALTYDKAAALLTVGTAG